MRPATTICMLIFATLGITWTAVYWSGLVAWCRVCSLPYAQVKGTPYEQMWTSFRGASGVVIVMMVLVWAITSWRCRGDRAKSPSNPALQATAAPPRG
jgi:hypothetical protein